MKSDIPPQSTERPSNTNEISNVDQELPPYFQYSTTPGWTIVINNRFFVDGFRIFVSLDASKKFEVFKNSKNAEVIDLQEQGYGVPIFKVITNSIPFSTKFLTFRRYVPTNLHPFNVDKDYYDFCTVNKTIHMGYDTYIFEFRPDPNSLALNFNVLMFSHNQLPIHDYIYRGNKYRWVDESELNKFRGEWFMKYAFRRTILSSQNAALTDNWNGVGDKLSKDRPNPYVGGFLKNMFSITSDYPKDEYYGQYSPDLLCESQTCFSRGYAELRIDNLRNSEPRASYESIFSLEEEDLVRICIATVLKRQKDIIEDRKK